MINCVRRQNDFIPVSDDRFIHLGNGQVLAISKISLSQQMFIEKMSISCKEIHLSTLFLTIYLSKLYHFSIINAIAFYYISQNLEVFNMEITELLPELITKLAPTGPLPTTTPAQLAYWREIGRAHV